MSFRSRLRRSVFVGLSWTMAVLVALSVEALDPPLMLSQYVQKKWTIDDGLPQNSVRAITQTADGYLWIGTEQGVARFDGIRFVTIDLTTAEGRQDGLVNALYPEDQTLWVGTNGGLYRLDDSTAIEILTNTKTSLGDVRSMLRDRSGRLWVVAEVGVFLVTNDRAQLFAGVPEGGLTSVTALAESPDGSRLCIANGRVFCLHNGAFTVLPEFDDATDAWINLITFDSSGKLWAGTNGSGVFCLADGAVQRFGTTEGLPHSFARALTVDHDDNVWAGSGASHLTRIHRNGFEVTSLGQAGSGVLALFEDDQDNLWIGCEGGGLIRFSSPLFKTFSVAEGLRTPAVRSVLEDQQGVVWIGTAGGGLHRLVDNRITHIGAEAGLAADDVMALTEDHRGRLWVGTGGMGVFVRDGDRFTAVQSPSRVILSLHEDIQGRMWAGAIGVVLRLDGTRLRPVEELSGITAAAILSDPEGSVWFANWNSGPVRWRDGQVKTYGRDQGVSDSMTLALHRDEANLLWAGFHLGGLSLLGDDAGFTFTTAHGLCDNSVFSILEGPAGRLWMTSNQGVFVVVRDQLVAVSRGLESHVECRLFGSADGMRSSECNGGQQPAAWRDRDDRLWFATTDGVVRVDPRDIAPRTAPPVVIEELVVGSSSHAITADNRLLELPPERRDLQLRYTAHHLLAPEQVRFRYRLEGLDREWVEAGQRRVAYYTNLPPRRYRFRVQAQLPGGAWSEDGAALNFRLQPRMWETWWFRGLGLCAVAAMAVAGHRTRMAAIRRKAQHLELLVAERTRELAEVNSTLERRVEEGIEALRESDRMAAYGHLVAGVAHEVRHPIFALRAASHLLTQKLTGSAGMQEELDILQRETDRMNRLVDDLLELGRPREMLLSSCRPGELIDEALASITDQAGGLPITIEIDSAAPAVLADRPAIIQVLVNLLVNAWRHAVGARRIIIGAHLDQDSGLVHLTVADDGAGISIADQSRIFEPFFSGSGSTGLGLAIAARLVREHDGRLSVESQKGAGTVFTVALRPAGSSH